MESLSRAYPSRTFPPEPEQAERSISTSAVHQEWMLVILTAGQACLPCSCTNTSLTGSIASRHLNHQNLVLFY